VPGTDLSRLARMPGTLSPGQVTVFRPRNVEVDQVVPVKSDMRRRWQPGHTLGLRAGGTGLGES
jgi:hypothetical protein